MKVDRVVKNYYENVKLDHSLLLPGLQDDDGVLVEVDGIVKNYYENVKLDHSLLLPGLPQGHEHHL